VSCDEVVHLSAALSRKVRRMTIQEARAHFLYHIHRVDSVDDLLLPFFRSVGLQAFCRYVGNLHFLVQFLEFI